MKFRLITSTTLGGNMSSVMRTDVENIIVVGIDGSEHSKSALRWAAKLAPLLNCTIFAVSIWQYPLMVGVEGMVTYEWEPDKEAQRVLDTTIDQVFGSHVPDGLSREIKQGNTTTELSELSKNATMLIVGKRGLGGFIGLLMGSVSRSVVEHAKCPVLVLHE